MQDNRCPNCENDITETVKATLVTMIQEGSGSMRSIACPHCGESLTVTAQVSTNLLRESASVR
jgi:hypothetical protein